MGTLAKSDDQYEMRLFIRVCTVCLEKKNIFRERKLKHICLEIITCVSLIYIMDYPKVMVSNQKEEFNSAGRGLILNLSFSIFRKVTLLSAMKL